MLTGGLSTDSSLASPTNSSVGRVPSRLCIGCGTRRFGANAATQTDFGDSGPNICPASRRREGTASGNMRTCSAVNIMRSIEPAKEHPMSTSSADRPLRVIQWTTGNIGRRSLHAIIGRPDMELVGVYAHGQDKVGVDAAELSGWPEPTGVHATNDIDALLALHPDACCYNPLWPERRRAGPPARVGSQRVHQRGLDHRRQADTGGPAAHRGRLRAGRVDDLRQRCAPGHDESGRRWC